MKEFQKRTPEDAIGTRTLIMMFISPIKKWDYLPYGKVKRKVVLVADLIPIIEKVFLSKILAAYWDRMI